MRHTFEETGMSYNLEVEMVHIAHEMDLFASPYAFNPEEAVKMTKAGADVIVAHCGWHYRWIYRCRNDYGIGCSS